MSSPDSAAASVLMAAPDDDDDGDVQFLNPRQMPRTTVGDILPFHSCCGHNLADHTTRRLGQSAGLCRHVSLNRLLSKNFCFITEAE